MGVVVKRFLILVAGIAASLVLLPFGPHLSPAHATTPSNGNYVCTTGLPATSGDTTNLYQITNGRVLPLSPKCSGAVVIPSGVTTIGPYAFMLSTITSVTIPETVTSIQVGAFSEAKLLTSVTIPASVTTIEGYAFSENSTLAAFAVHENNPNFASISGVLFNKAGTVLLSYPLGKTATSYVIPNGATTLAESAFYTAGLLTSVTIPASANTIERFAFDGARSLTGVYFFGNAPVPGNFAFGNIGTSPKAFIKTGATGFGAVGSTWNGLTVEIPSFAVTYNSNGGSTISSGTFAAGSSIDAPTAPSLAGHTFTGWSDTDGGTLIVFPYSPDAMSGITLYAKWTSNPVPVAPVASTTTTVLTTTTTATTSTTSTMPLASTTTASFVSTTVPPASLPAAGSDKQTNLIMVSLLLFCLGLVIQRIKIDAKE